MLYVQVLLGGFAAHWVETNDFEKAIHLQENLSSSVQKTKPNCNGAGLFLRHSGSTGLFLRLQHLSIYLLFALGCLHLLCLLYLRIYSFLFWLIYPFCFFRRGDLQVPHRTLVVPGRPQACVRHHQRHSGAQDGDPHVHGQPVPWRSGVPLP